MHNISFADIAIVSCGTLSLELNYLKKEGFLDTNYLYYTTPGLHEDIHQLEHQLIKEINKETCYEIFGGVFKPDRKYP